MGAGGGGGGADTGAAGGMLGRLPDAEPTVLMLELEAVFRLSLSISSFLILSCNNTNLIIVTHESMSHI